VINSSYVLARYLADRAPGSKVFAIGESPLLAELEEAGLSLCDDPEKVEYVIAAFDRTLTYEKLNIGFQAIRRGSHFVATNPDRTCPIEGGEIPDAAGVIAALEATTGKKVEQHPHPERRHLTDGSKWFQDKTKLCNREYCGPC